jgi:hypothetical protein
MSLWKLLGNLFYAIGISVACTIVLFAAMTLIHVFSGP